MTDYDSIENWTDAKVRKEYDHLYPIYHAIVKRLEKCANIRPIRPGVYSGYRNFTIEPEFTTESTSTNDWGLQP